MNNKTYHNPEDGQMVEKRFEWIGSKILQLKSTAIR